MPNFQHSKEEITFLESIDCQFPYQDQARAIALVEQACAISPNAAFAVVDEISRPPANELVSIEFSTTLLSLIEQQLLHPLVPSIIGIARKLVLDQSIPVMESVLVMREVEQFPGQYSALSIAYFACDDVDGIADAEFNRINAIWEK
jgi:hypothetical protein